MGVRGVILAALLGVGLGAGQVTPLIAQERPPNAILTIDQEQLFSGSLFGERVGVEIREDLTQLEVEFKKLETELTTEEKALTERRPSLTPDDFRLLADAFDEKVQSIRREQDAKARALDQRLEQERARYYGLVDPILREMMADLGATVIIDRRAILIGSEGVDITHDALRLIDATLGDGATPPGAPQE